MTTGLTPLDVLPHRPPFLFIDEVVDSTEKTVSAVRTFRPDEPFFEGHFPGNPIVPGVLLIEAMAQALAYLLRYEDNVHGVYLTGVDRARFRKPVLPGQKVELRVRVESKRMGVVRARAQARVGGERVAEAILSGVKDRGDDRPSHTPT